MRMFPNGPSAFKLEIWSYCRVFSEGFNSSLRMITYRGLAAFAISDKLMPAYRGRYRLHPDCISLMPEGRP